VCNFVLFVTAPYGSMDGYYLVYCGFMAALTGRPRIKAGPGIRQAIIFLPCGFFLSSFFFPRLISAVRLDVYRTSTHGAALVRI